MNLSFFLCHSLHIEVNRQVIKGMCESAAFITEYGT